MTGKRREKVGLVNRKSCSNYAKTDEEKELRASGIFENDAKTEKMDN